MKKSKISRHRIPSIIFSIFLLIFFGGTTGKCREIITENPENFSRENLPPVSSLKEKPGGNSKNKSGKLNPAVNSTNKKNPADKKLLSIEGYFAAQTFGSGVSAVYRQFGYEMFEKNVSTFAPINNVPVGPDYIIGPGDSFTVSLWGKVEATYPVKVNREGKVIIPEIGVVHVWGLTFKELKKTLEAEIKIYIPDFQMNITMRGLRVIQVFVVGNVLTPGSYTVSSLSTMINVLFACGGPKKNGTLRKIQLIRNGKPVTTFDLYDFLLRGDKSHDERIQDGDTVFVPLIGEVVAVTGSVKRPAIYEIDGKSTLGDLLNLSGGVSPTGYLKRVQVERVLAHERKIMVDLNLSSDKPESAQLEILLQDRDIVKISPISPMISNIVVLKGHLERPGKRQFVEGMKISDLIASFNDIRPEPYLEYAEIIRIEQPDFHEKIISFNLGEMLKKNPKHDLELHKFDRIKIYSKLDFEDKNTVTISGEIRKPGVFPLRENMRISTLIRSAGYLTSKSHLSWAMFSRLKDPSKAAKNRFDREFIHINLAEALKGNPKYDLLLRNRDEIEIFSKWHFEEKYSVIIEGEVRQPKKYDLPENMRISTLIHRAGDLTNNAYRQWAMLSRLKDPAKEGGKGIDREFIYINAAEAIKGNPEHDLLLQNHDLLKIYSKWHFQDRFTVNIEGQVRKPGKFDLLENMRISTLIRKAGNLTPEAYLEKAEVFRVTPDRNIKTIFINLKKALAGETKENILLQNEDRLVIHNIWETKEKSTVSVDGKVNKSGQYLLTIDMRVSDLIFRAGGVKENAYLKKVELTRMVIKHEGMKTEQIIIDLEKALKGDREADILLRKYDALKVRIIPDWKEKRIVTISSEVRFPGAYNIGKEEKLSSLIKRSGGYTDEAFLKGAVFTRKSIKKQQRKSLDKLIKRQELEVVSLSNRLAQGSISESDVETTKQTIQFQKIMLDKLKHTEVTGRIVIRLAELDELVGSEYDITLKDGDELTIPPQPDTVSVLGEVYNPISLLYRDKKTVSYYLDKVGGPTEKANEDQIFLIRADGSVISRSQDGIFSISWDDDGRRWTAGGFMALRMNPGDSLLVPRELEKVQWLKESTQLSQVLYQIAIAVGVAATLF